MPNLSKNFPWRCNFESKGSSTDPIPCHTPPPAPPSNLLWIHPWSLYLWCMSQGTFFSCCLSYICMFHVYTVFNLITAHTPTSAQSSSSVVFRLQPVYFSSTSLYRHMLWVPIWIASICWCNSNEYPQISFYRENHKKNKRKKKNKKKQQTHQHHQISPLLIFFFFLKCTLSRHIYWTKKETFARLQWDCFHICVY